MKEDGGLEESDPCGSTHSSPLAISTPESPRSLNENVVESDISNISDFIHLYDDCNTEEPVTNSTGMCLHSPITPRTQRSFILPIIDECFLDNIKY